MSLEKAKDYFERHPSSDECHITSDGRVFHTHGSAEGFAGTLDDDKIESFKRKVIMTDKKAQKEVKDSDNQEAEKLAKIAELEALELVTANYNQMKPLVKYFDLKVEDQKAETLIAALTELKNTLVK